MREEKKLEKRKRVTAICLDTFIEKGLTVTTTKDLSTAAGVQNGGIFYYFSTKEEIILTCAEEAIDRIEKRAFDIALNDLTDIENMFDQLGALADQMAPTMRFLVSVCVTNEYGDKVKPLLEKLAGRYPDYTNRIAQILGCSVEAVEPIVHLSILALNNYMIFGERALFNPQMQSAKRELMRLAGEKQQEGKSE